MVSAANKKRSQSQLTMVCGAIFNPINQDQCDYYPDGALVYLSRAKESEIIYCGRREQAEIIFLHYEGTKNRKDFFNHPIVPGFYDMHFHWVQDEVRLKGKSSLLSWLKKYTWPYESKFSAREFSQKMAEKFFKRLRRAGTLGGGIYSSLHGHALEIAMKQAQGHFVIGNVLMAMNSPDYLQQSSSQAMALMKKFSQKFKQRYALTPRFAPTTPPEVMKFASELSQKHGCFIQTHLAETPEECEYVKGLFKELKGFEDIKDYTTIYQRCGLLGPRSFFGHGIYLSDREMKALARSKSAIIHCPTSNAPIKDRGLGSGLFDFYRANQFGLRWALGSDIGGGPYLSMIDVMRSFVLQNIKSKGTNLAKRQGADFTQALYRATLAGAELLDLDKRAGNLMVGKRADFLILKQPLKKTTSTAEAGLQEWILRNQKNRVKDDSEIKFSVLNGCF